MTAWGVVAVCGIGGGAAGPFIDTLARKIRRPAAPCVELAAAGGAATAVTPVAGEPAPRRAGGFELAVVVVSGAAACLLAAERLGAVPQLAAYCVLALSLLTVSVTDLRTGLVPRRFVYPATASVGAALLAASATDDSWRPMLDALAGAAVAFAVFALVWWIAPKAMGFGDVRLAGLCGGALGWLGFAPLYLGFLAAFVAGALMGVAVLLTHGRRRFPFAPALAVGTMFGVLWGAWLGHLWLHG